MASQKLTLRKDPRSSCMCVTRTCVAAEPLQNAYFLHLKATRAWAQVSSVWLPRVLAALQVYKQGLK